jgi:hypothetical protein
VLQKIREIKRNEYGGNGSNMPSPSDSPMIFGCLTYNQNSKLMLLEHSPQHSDNENFLSQTKKAWLLQQSKRPWQNWVRSLGQTWGTTPHMEVDLNHCIHYLPDNSKE